VSQLTLTEKQAIYIANYIEHEFSERASELTLTDVILEAIESINGGAMDDEQLQSTQP
jgi:hypothetical protein|tara:strand:- start:123 stop:296 length:174 start_codon:yes stop_codon:yes gene_type:complete